jgi:PAS domain S-box-containing protein
LTPRISFASAQFDRIFPFYILIDRELRVVSYGKTIHKLFPGIAGNPFFDHFLIKRPEFLTLDFDSLLMLINQLIIIECHNSIKTILRGQIEYLEEDDRLLFIGSPWFGSMEQVVQNQLRLDDFAFHDPMIDLLHVLKTQEITTEELKKLIHTINKQKNDLKAAAKEIHDIALFPMQNPDPLIRIDLQGNVLTLNPVAEKFSEFNFNNRNYTSTEFWQEIARRVDQGKDREIIEAKSGDKWYSFVIRPLPKDGYFNIYGRDVTIDKYNEDQLLILSSIAAQNTHGVVIADREGRIEWINKSFELMTGYGIEEMRGKKPGQILQGKDTDKETIAYLKNQISQGEPFVCEILNYHRSGRPYWLRIQGQALKDKDNKVIKYFAIEEDITREKETQKKLKEFESRFRIALEKIGDNVWEYDFIKNKTDFSDMTNQFLGYDISKVKDINSFWWDHVYKDDLDLLINNDKKVRNAEIDHHALEYRMHHQDGSIKWVLDRGVVIEKSIDGKPLKIIGTHTDVTKQKNLEIDLREAKNNAEASSRVKELFLANMSHEIRTPLNAIIGLIRDISRESLSPTQSLYIKNAELASQHLLSIVNNILDITKIESGQMSLDLGPFSLVETINNTISILSIQAGEKMLEFKSEISQELSSAYIGDSNRIRQILLNILNNAIKFTERGSVVLRCALNGKSNNIHHLRFTITDTGIGMKESFLENIFQKFTQGDLSTARKYGGTGLGMAITYELVQLMKGKITISSKIDSGTSVDIYIDLEVADENQIQSALSTDSFNVLKKKEILLVEDNDLNRLVVVNSLKYFGMNVTEATNGMQAIERLKQSPYDLILMDLQMPEMGGIEAATIIRQEMKLNIPIIALTANAFKAEIDRCKEAGMNDYIIKPFEEKTLLSIIHKNITSSISKISPGKEPEESTKLFNLDYLQQLSRGNDDFIKKLIRIFIEQTPPAVEQIKTAWNEGDWLTIKSAAHRIKPTIDNFGISDLKQDIRAIESLAGEGQAKPELESKIKRLDEIIRLVVEQLQNEI